MPWNKIVPWPGAFYKDHFICFSYRKMIRKLYVFEVPREELKVSDLVLLCPERRKPLCSVGKAFHPPRQSAVKKWREIEEQYKRRDSWPNGR